MNAPLVSIIIPAYNPGALILETITSVLGQTYKNIEVIVVDDGSKDETALRLSPLVEAKKITYFYQENQGQAAARKKGFELSHGEFISFVDADDLIAKDKIQLQVEYLEAHPEYGVCYSGIAHFWHHKPERLLHKKLTYYSGDILPHLIHSNFIQVMTALIRRKPLEEYGVPGARFRRSDDWYLWLNLALHGVQFGYIEKILSFQRRQAQGTLSDQKTYFKETAETNLFVYDEFKGVLSPSDVIKYDLEGLIQFWTYRLAIGYIILKDKKQARITLAGYVPQTVLQKVKKALLQLILFFPASLTSWAILQAREFLKHQSFEEMYDPTVRLPSLPSL